jgi:hypothetical protein
MFRRGIRKRKKRLYKIVSLLIPSGEAYIWRCRVSPELKRSLLGLGYTSVEVKE